MKIPTNYIKQRVGLRNRKVWRNKWDQRKLNNKSFSLFSHNCLGGVMYHDLGVEFQSPVINMRFTPHDFIRMITNLDRYMHETIVFIEADKKYPVGVLGDIVIEFVHYKTQEEVIEKWENRKKRIHKDNMFFMCNDEGLTYDEMKLYDSLPYKNKILFSSVPRDEIKCSVYCPDFPEYTNVELIQFSNWFGKRYYQEYFDYVKWFNGDADYKL